MISRRMQILKDYKMLSRWRIPHYSPKICHRSPQGVAVATRVVAPPHLIGTSAK